MHANSTGFTPPRLLKARMRHTKLFILLLAPLILFAGGIIQDGGLVHEALEWVGYLLVILCVMGRIFCTAFIGGRKNAELIIQGPYTVVRNPLYVFSFIGVIGIGLQSGMFSVLALLILAFWLYYPSVVKREEAFLLHTFGQAYADYMQRVPRWIPKFSLWRMPEEVTTRPQMILNSMLDATMFFVPLMFFELIEMFHAYGWLPNLMYLP